MGHDPFFSFLSLNSLTSACEIPNCALFFCLDPGSGFGYVPGGGGAPRLRLRAHQGGHQLQGQASRQEEQPCSAQPGAQPA